MLDVCDLCVPDRARRTRADAFPRPASASASASAAPSPQKLRKVGSEGTLVLSVPKDVEEIRTMSAYGRLKLFTYHELRKATGNFNPGQIVGEGGFGVVYRGVIDGSVRKGYPSTAVAVKVLNPQGLQGDREWLVWSGLWHRHRSIHLCARASVMHVFRASGHPSPISPPTT
jgi:hypothetical protein